MELELFFIDFQQAFDSLLKDKLMTALKELGIDYKLRRLGAMIMKQAKVSIITQKGEIESFVAYK